MLNDTPKIVLYSLMTLALTVFDYSAFYINNIYLESEFVIWERGKHYIMAVWSYFRFSLMLDLVTLMPYLSMYMYCTWYMLYLS